jgi:hypothetical protein
MRTYNLIRVRPPVRRRLFQPLSVATQKSPLVAIVRLLVRGQMGQLLLPEEQVLPVSARPSRGRGLGNRRQVLHEWGPLAGHQWGFLHGHVQPSKHTFKIAVMLMYSYATRHILWLWLPNDQYLPETYELAPLDHSIVRNGFVDVKAHRFVPVAITVMNQENLYPLFKQGDLDVTIYFQRQDGKLFSSDQMAFNVSAISQHFVPVDVNDGTKTH